MTNIPKFDVPSREPTWIIKGEDSYDLFVIAEQLARSLGHTTECNFVKFRKFPCNCGAAQQQTVALDSYQQWKLNYK